MEQRYTLEDIETFYNAKTLFYEFGMDEQPIKHPDIIGDDNGDVLYIGRSDWGEYSICYHTAIDSVPEPIEECVNGQRYLLKVLNNGTVRPIESYDTENIFNQLEESKSIRRIIKESLNKEKISIGDIFSVDGDNKPKIKTLILVVDIIQDGKPGIRSAQTMWGTKQYESDGYSLKYMTSDDNGNTWTYEDGGHYVDTGWIDGLIKDGHWRLLQKGNNEISDFFDSLNESDDLEWAQDVVNTDPYYKPDGKIPRIGESVRILCKSCEWMAGYETCFQNPFDIVGVVTEVHKSFITINSFCETDYDGEVSLLVPFAYGPYVRQTADMNAYGIKILPYVE